MSFDVQNIGANVTIFTWGLSQQFKFYNVEHQRRFWQLENGQKRQIVSNPPVSVYLQITLVVLSY